MTIVTSKSTGNVIASADFNATINKIQNGTDNDVKIAGTTTSDATLFSLTRTCISTTVPMISVTQASALDSQYIASFSGKGGICINQNIDSGKGLYISRNNGTESYPLAEFVESHSTSNRSTVSISSNAAYYAQTITTTNSSNLYGGLLISCTGATDGSATHAALGINNTSNTGVGLWVYSNQGASQNSGLVQIQIDNVAFDNSAMNIIQAGTGAALAVSRNNTAATCAFTIVGTCGVNLVDFRNNNKGANTNIATFCDANTSWTGFFSRNLAAADTAYSVVLIEDVNSGDDQNGLEIRQSGTGYGLYINQTNPVGRGLRIDSAITDATAPTCVDIRCNSLTSGVGLWVNSSSNAFTGYPGNPGLVNITQTGSASNTGMPLWVVTTSNQQWVAQYNSPKFGINIEGTSAASAGCLFRSHDNVASSGTCGVFQHESASAQGITLAVYHAGTGPTLYLQPQAAPTTSLTAGCMYINSTDKQLYVYDGSAWQGVSFMDEIKYVLKYMVSDDIVVATTNNGIMQNNYWYQQQRYYVAEGNYRIRYRTYGEGTTTFQTQLRKNNVAIGTTRTLTNDPVERFWEEDITGFAKGDELTLWSQRTSGGGTGACGSLTLKGKAPDLFVLNN